MYDTRSYLVQVYSGGAEKLRVTVLAVSRFHAIDKVYTLNSGKYPDRSQYRARLAHRV